MVKLPESKSLQHYLSSNKSEKGAKKEAVVNKNWRVRLVLLLFSGDFYFLFYSLGFFWRSCRAMVHFCIDLVDSGCLRFLTYTQMLP